MVAPVYFQTSGTWIRIVLETWPKSGLYDEERRVADGGATKSRWWLQFDFLEFFLTFSDFYYNPVH